MNTRKKRIKLLAITLCVTLMGIGAVPAAADCSTDCCCKAPSKIHMRDNSSIHQVTSHIRDHEKVKQGHPPVHTFFLIVQSDVRETDCQEKSTPSTCEMTPLYSQDAYKGLIQTAPRPDHTYEIFSTVNVGTFEDDAPFTRPTARAGLMARAGPQPLYIQNLSFLI